MDSGLRVLTIDAPGIGGFYRTALNRVGSGLWVAPLLYLLAEEFGGQGSRLVTLGLLLLLWGLMVFLLRAFRAAYHFALTPLLLIHASSRLKHQFLGYPAYFWDLKYQVSGA